MLFWKRNKKSDDNTKVKVIRPIIEKTRTDERITISLVGFKEVTTTIGAEKRRKEKYEKKEQERKKKEKELTEWEIILDVAISLLALKKLYKSNYHKGFLDNFQSFKDRHAILLAIAEKNDYSRYKEKAIDYYLNQYDDSLESYQYDYLNNPALLDLGALELQCLENTYCQFRDYWSFQLNEYKQKAAKKKRLFYLVEQTDIFISIAEEINCNRVVSLANETKSKYFSMIEVL